MELQRCKPRQGHDSTTSLEGMSATTDRTLVVTPSPLYAYPLSGCMERGFCVVEGLTQVEADSKPADGGANPSRPAMTKEERRAKRAEGDARYRAKHYDERHERNARYDLEHRDERHERIVRYRTTHRDELRSKSSEYAHNHPEKVRLYAAKRRALKYENTPIDELLTEAQWRDVLDQHHHRCAYCGVRSDHLTIDHVIPLSRGGKHSANNVVPACETCNKTKNAKTPEEWVGIHVQ